jgi:hypothetical protein
MSAMRTVKIGAAIVTGTLAGQLCTLEWKIDDPAMVELCEQSGMVDAVNEAWRMVPLSALGIFSTRHGLARMLSAAAAQRLVRILSGHLQAAADALPKLARGAA